MKHDPNEFVWAQKYRPKTVDDCILPASTKSMVEGLISQNDIPHMLFSGGPGLGKTTLAYAIANELGADVLYLNASMENGIEVLRTTIQSFAASVSLESDGAKIVILDEADGLSGPMQGALKGFLEAFSANCRFVLTANHKHKIIEPLHSRCTVIDFKTEGKERATIAMAILKRCTEILDTEEIPYDKKVLAELISRNFPDFRRILNTIQRYAASGRIDSGILIDLNQDNFKELYGYIKNHNFTDAQKWVRKNVDGNDLLLFRALFDDHKQFMSEKSLAQLVLILADYQYKAAFVADKEINMLACIAEIMSSCG